jgi:hypothetical protein
MLNFWNIEFGKIPTSQLALSKINVKREITIKKKKKNFCNVALLNVIFSFFI